ncbi:MAG: GYD domain-containing protein, partial [Chloroflexota bacterium]|nr:GYD domain-containing protein [Chloroflexota bacterium]
ARASAEKHGGRLLSVYWTQGKYDLVSISEWPDEETANGWFLALASLGNVRSHTLRAFGAEEMARIVSKLP